MEFSQDFDKDTQLVVAASAVRQRRAEKRMKPNLPCCYSAVDEAEDFIIRCDDGVGRAREINS